MSCIYFFVQNGSFLHHQQEELVVIPRSACCSSLSQWQDICDERPSNCTDLCPDLKSLKLRLEDDIATFLEKETRAFFLETLGDGVLNVRQACSVESLAMHNPNLTVYVLFTGGKINSSVTTTQTLKEKYNNIRLVEIHLDHYLAGTPLEHWYHCTNWKNGPYHVSHLSDGLRFLTLAKYGGYYFDLDVILVRPVTLYRNFISAESIDAVSSGAFHTDYEHPLMQMAVEDFPLNYKPDLWAHNGPDLLMRILKKWCEVEGLQSMNYVTCKGLNILSANSFSPVFYSSWKEIFNKRPANDTAKPTWLTNQVIGVHVWNKLSSKKRIYKNSTQYYTQLARAHCPEIFNVAPEIF